MNRAGLQRRIERLESKLGAEDAEEVVVVFLPPVEGEDEHEAGYCYGNKRVVVRFVTPEEVP